VAGLPGGDEALGELAGLALAENRLALILRRVLISGSVWGGMAVLNDLPER
jgi:hypothetical protein